MLTVEREIKSQKSRISSFIFCFAHEEGKSDTWYIRWTLVKTFKSLSVARNTIDKLHGSDNWQALVSACLKFLSEDDNNSRFIKYMCSGQKVSVKR